MNAESSDGGQEKLGNCDGKVKAESGVPFPSPSEVSQKKSTKPVDESNTNDGNGHYADRQDVQVPETSHVNERRAFGDRFTIPQHTPRLFASRDGETPAAPIPTASAVECKTYILRVCRALIMFGAPTHRLEDYMQRTAEALQLHLQAFYLPSCMIISFDDDLGHSVDVQIITCPQALNLAKLDSVHQIYKGVIHRKICAKKATTLVDDLLTQREEHPRWFRVLMYGLASAFIGPVSYGARPVDLPFIFILACIVGLLELIVTAKSALYGYIFEMTSAILVSFAARGLGSFRLAQDKSLCFPAIAQASLVLILPGFTITSSALELQSRMMISGATRLVYGIIYTLFLAFGFIVGIAIYGAIDSNATSSTTCDSSWPFWWQIAFVIPFTFCYVIVNQAKWRQIPAMLVVTMAGWLVNHFSALRFPTVQSLPNALGALAVGILSNLYSRLARGLAIAVMHPAIFILVPGSFAASGSLIEGLMTANQLTNQPNNITGSSALDTYASGKSSALYAGYAMIEIAIGITAGLSVSALLIYPIRKKGGRGGLFTY